MFERFERSADRRMGAKKKDTDALITLSKGFSGFHLNPIATQEIYKTKGFRFVELFYDKKECVVGLKFYKNLVSGHLYFLTSSGKDGGGSKISCQDFIYSTEMDRMFRDREGKRVKLVESGSNFFLADFNRDPISNN